MIFKEEFVLEVPQQEAWKFLSDFPGPIQILPGLTSLKQTTPNAYTGAIQVKIGLITFHFQGDMNIILVDPASYRVNLCGGAHDHQLGGHFKALARTQTLPHGPNCCRVLLEIEVGLGGLMGKLGLFVLRPFARQITHRYAELAQKEILNRRHCQIIEADMDTALSVAS